MTTRTQPNRFLQTLLSVGIVACMMFIMLPAWGACTLTVQAPTPDGSNVEANGGHAQCASSTHSDVYLFHQKFGPDSELAHLHDTGINVYLHPAHACLETGGDSLAAYYTRVEGDAGSGDSSLYWRDC